eukprot:361354-Chlamydomonas_euryale.AAC.7
MQERARRAKAALRPLSQRPALAGLCVERRSCGSVTHILHVIITQSTFVRTTDTLNSPEPAPNTHSVNLLPRAAGSRLPNKSLRASSPDAPDLPHRLHVAAHDVRLASACLQLLQKCGHHVDEQVIREVRRHSRCRGRVHMGVRWDRARRRRAQARSKHFGREGVGGGVREGRNRPKIPSMRRAACSVLGCFSQVFGRCRPSPCPLTPYEHVCSGPAATWLTEAVRRALAERHLGIVQVGEADRLCAEGRTKNERALWRKCRAGVGTGGELEGRTLASKA